MNRRVEWLTRDKWTSIEFHQLRTGDVFRLREPSGALVKTESNATAFRCLSDKPYEDDGVLMVNCQEVRITKLSEKSNL